ncbi:MAG: diguanylate cyclase [Ruminococcus sp.]|nr:diguanylate cyclase [Ruminococcus sp.]
MTLQIKVIALTLLCLLIPGIIISVTSYEKAKSAAFDEGVDYLNSSAAFHALSVTTYIEEIETFASDIVSDSRIKSFTAAATATGGNADADLTLYTEERLKNLSLYNTDLVEVMIIGENGKVLASTLPYNIGNTKENYSELSDNPGVSGFESFENANGVIRPSFSVATNIYSESNSIIGVLYEIFYTGSLEQIISNTDTDVSTTLALADSDNDLIVYDFKAVVNMTDKNVEFAPYVAAVSQKMDFLFSTDNPGEVVLPFVAEGAGKSRIFAMTEIPKAGWVFLSSTDHKAFTNQINISVSNIPLQVLLLVFGAAGLIFIGVYFLSPMATIMTILGRKTSGGDVASRIAFTDHKDEFDTLRDDLNDLFDRIAEGELKYETMVEMTNNIVFTIDLKTSTVEMSKNFNKKFSFRPKDNTIEESFIYKIRVHKDDKEKYLGDMDAILKEANFIDGEYRIKNLYGDFAWVVIKATKFFDRNENPSKIIGVIVDIDKDKKSKMSLLQRANYDALTQIYNRETFLKNLSETIESTRHKKDLAAVLFIDLDDFKHFNDDYSHACGDEVLKFTADTLKEITFERGFAGRFGGDEFVSCLTKLTLYSDAGVVAQEIIDILSRGFISESTGQKLAVHCSVGISFLHESGKTTEEVIASADAAMYNIKKHGKSAFAYAQKDDAPPPIEITPKPIDRE